MQYVSTFLKQRLQVLNFFLIGIFFTVNGEEVVEDETISCFTCGLEEIDPELDLEGSYGDIRKEGTPESRKMYNHTCDIADELANGGAISENWVRKCPKGVKSCFWAKGLYQKQGRHIFCN